MEGKNHWYLNNFSKLAVNIHKHFVMNHGSNYKFYPGITVDVSASTIWDNSVFYQNPGMKEPECLTPDYIKATLPHAKMVVIVRNPTARMYSDYLYFTYGRRDPETFHSTVSMAVTHYNNCMDNLSTSFGYCLYSTEGNNDALFRLRIGLYYYHIQTWLTVFPREQVHILRLEDYSAHPVDSLVQIFAFLGVSKMSRDAIEQAIHYKIVQNIGYIKKKFAPPGPMLNQTRKMLDDFYRESNIKLAELMNDTLFTYNQTEVNRNKMV
jgi:N-acetylgalactosamine 4-sulfate 6-O-sulfotransferase